MEELLLLLLPSRDFPIDFSEFSCRVVASDSLPSASIRLLRGGGLFASFSM
jgi:hypothetical protein